MNMESEGEPLLKNQQYTEVIPDPGANVFTNLLLGFSVLRQLDKLIDFAQKEGKISKEKGAGISNRLAEFLQENCAGPKTVQISKQTVFLKAVDSFLRSEDMFDVTIKGRVNKASSEFQEFDISISDMIDDLAWSITEWIVENPKYA